jgi:hypothetical protein
MHRRLTSALQRTCPSLGLGPTPVNARTLDGRGSHLDIRGDGSLRYGTRIDLTHQCQTIQIMSVHLKSGYFENASTSLACETLLAQVPITDYYHQVPGAAAVAVLKGAGHNTIQQTGDGFIGYINAWMLYVLRHDHTARGAFIGAPPEINTNPSWQNQAEKNFP